MTRADMLEAWGEYLAHGRRRSPHTVRAYVATAARLLDELGEMDWPALADGEGEGEVELPGDAVGDAVTVTSAGSRSQRR